MTYAVLRSAEALVRHLEAGHPLAGCILQGLNLTVIAPTLLARDVREAVFLGCTLTAEQQAQLTGRGALVFPDLRKGRPYNPARADLYTYDELMHGFSAKHPGSVLDTLDAHIHAHFQRHRRYGSHPIIETLAQRLHDHAIDEALARLLARPEAQRVVGVMGGHSLLRGSALYQQVARLGYQLARSGYLVATGGGPGAMEAANLGAWMSCYDEVALDTALGILARATDYHTHDYVVWALSARAAFPEGAPSLAIPTWFYGHEPSNPFASYIAKYFSNSLREDGLLAIAKHGVVYTPGSAGTIQEVFMDATQNHYGTFDVVSPMVFFDETEWSRYPVLELLQKLAGDRAYARTIYQTSRVAEAVDFIRSHPPEHFDPSEFLGIVHASDHGPVYADALNAVRRLEPTESAAVPPLGSYVVARPSPSNVSSAELVRVLARSDSGLADLYELLAANGHTPCFSTAVRREVEGWLAKPDIDAPDLLDLEALAFVTVDGESSKDLDQALYLRKREGGGLTVYYALADASHYVRPGSALFAEAMHRAASYYLPSVMVPMLPRELSEGLVSLNPEVSRRAVVFEMQLDDMAEVVSSRVLRARVRSRAKLSFSGVQAYYDEPDSSDIVDPAIRCSLDLLRTFGELRLRRSGERDIVRYRRVELQVELPNRSCRGFLVNEAIRHPVERYNEQLSLLCNEQGATLLQRASQDPHVEPIFRVHPEPEAKSFEAFRSLTEAVADAHGLDARWRWRREQTLADYLAALPEEPRSVAQALHRQAVMVNVGSVFQQAPGGHYGVGADVYARFSAPMREIVGVYLHRELVEAVTGQTRADAELRAEVIERANAARQLQRRLTNGSNLLVLDQIFRGAQVEDRTLCATIVGLTESKAYVTLSPQPVDAKVHLRDHNRSAGDTLRLTSDRCGLVDEAGTLRFRLGDEVGIRVVEHESASHHWLLVLLPGPLHTQ